MSVVEPEKIAELEALLFYYGEPIAIKKIAKILNRSQTECEALLNAFETILKNDSSRACLILRNGEEVQLVTKPTFKNLAEKLLLEEFREELTPASLETLAIVAYLGPISRAAVDYIRGVNSSFTLRNLLMRGLIEKETETTKSNAYHYRVTFDFLKHMGLTKIQELPEYDKVRGVLEKLGQSESINQNQ